jgi:predicted DsbA family dithiol-disulfide isomerase
VLIRIVADMRAAAVTIFTDPYCPWSWAAEPHLRRLEVEFGAQVRPSFVIVGLPHPERLALDALDAAAESGMPVDARVFLRDPPASTHPAGLALHAVAEQAYVGPFLRRLREAILVEGRRMDSAPALLDAARETGGLDLERLKVDFGSAAILEAFGADLERGRDVAVPSLEVRAEDGAVHGAYGYRPYEDWREALVAAGLEPAAEVPTVEQALRRWPALATPEVAAACALPLPRAAAELWRLALDW